MGQPAGYKTLEEDFVVIADLACFALPVGDDVVVFLGEECGPKRV